MMTPFAVTRGLLSLTIAAHPCTPLSKALSDRLRPSARPLAPDHQEQPHPIALE
jgi:hypothetical protein